MTTKSISIYDFRITNNRVPPISLIAVGTSRNLLNDETTALGGTERCFTDLLTSILYGNIGVMSIATTLHKVLRGNPMLLVGEPSSQRPFRLASL